MVVVARVVVVSVTYLVDFVVVVAVVTKEVVDEVESAATFDSAVTVVSVMVTAEAAE